MVCVSIERRWRVVERWADELKWRLGGTRSSNLDDDLQRPCLFFFFFSCTSGGLFRASVSDAPSSFILSIQVQLSCNRPPLFHWQPPPSPRSVGNGSTEMLKFLSKKKCQHFHRQMAIKRVNRTVFSCTSCAFPPLDGVGGKVAAFSPETEEANNFFLKKKKNC